MEQETGATQEAQNQNQNQQGAGASAAPAMDDKQKKMLIGILAYIGILVVVAYLLGKDDAFTKFHIKQGFVLLILEVAVMVISYAMPFFYMFGGIINLVFIAFSIIGIVNVIQGKEKELPGIGSFAKHLPI